MSATARFTIPLGHGLTLQEARFLSRPNQFTLLLEREGEALRAAMADRGRLKRLLVPGRTILIEPREGAHRKTAFQALAAVSEAGYLVSLDTHLPNRLVAEALARGALTELTEFGEVRRWQAERTIGRSRFDFIVELRSGERVIVEVKSMGRLDEDGVARFPDAPTTRGARHLAELGELAELADTRCAVLFIVQGDQVTSAAIDAETDPAFARAVRHALNSGVSIWARACPLTRDGLSWGDPIAFTPP